MRKIYIVFSDVSYEGSEVYLIFEDETEANKTCERMNKAQKPNSEISFSVKAYDVISRKLR